MATILDGKKLSEHILESVQKDVARLGVKIRLAIVVVGENAASELYIQKKKEQGERLGVEVKIYRVPEDTSTKKLRAEVSRICKLPRTSGLIVQLPLPGQINARAVLNAVSPEKDVDVLSERASGALYTGHATVLPPTVAGIIRLLEEYKISVSGKHVVVVGFGKLVGKPASLVFAQRGATVTIVRQATPNAAELIKGGDIIVAGVGKPGLITKDMVKKGAVVVDAGDTQQNNPPTPGAAAGRSKTVGDVAPDVADVASYITPVPGGVGPMTVAMLFSNLLVLRKKVRKEQ